MSKNIKVTDKIEQVKKEIKRVKPTEKVVYNGRVLKAGQIIKE